MKRKSLSTIIFLVALLQVQVVADTYISQPFCNEPYKPFQFNSEYELEQYHKAVEDYVECMAEFIEEQQEEAQSHLDAAAEASRKLNRFMQSNY